MEDGVGKAAWHGVSEPEWSERVCIRRRMVAAYMVVGSLSEVRRFFAQDCGDSSSLAG